MELPWETADALLAQQRRGATTTTTTTKPPRRHTTTDIDNEYDVAISALQSVNGGGGDGKGGGGRKTPPRPPRDRVIVGNGGSNSTSIATHNDVYLDCSDPVSARAYNAIPPAGVPRSAWFTPHGVLHGELNPNEYVPMSICIHAASAVIRMVKLICLIAT